MRMLEIVLFLHLLYMRAMGLQLAVGSGHSRDMRHQSQLQSFGVSLTPSDMMRMAAHQPAQDKLVLSAAICTIANLEHADSF